MIILQINYMTRVIDRIYTNIYQINTEEYDLSLIIKCCNGEIPYYGGKYCDYGIWRYANDLVYLDGNFNFIDRDMYGNTISIPSRIDNEYDIQVEKSKNDSFNKNNTDNKYNNCNINSNYLMNIRRNAFYNINNPVNNFPFGIVQLEGSNIIKIYPHISFIPDILYDKRIVKCCLDGDCSNYKGYNWVYYDKIFNRLTNNITV